MNKKVVAFSIGFCIVCLLFGVYWMNKAFYYQDKLIKLNQENYELHQSIEMYKMVTGEIK